MYVVIEGFVGTVDDTPEWVGHSTPVQVVAVQTNTDLNIHDKLTITTDVVDMAGNALEQTYSWSFTTNGGPLSTSAAIETDEDQTSSPITPNVNDPNNPGNWFDAACLLYLFGYC